MIDARRLQVNPPHIEPARPAIAYYTAFIEVRNPLTLAVWAEAIDLFRTHGIPDDARLDGDMHTIRARWERTDIPGL